MGNAWIFTNNNNKYTSIAQNVWQSHLTIFELTELMRQRDDTSFAELLTRTRAGKQTEKVVSVLKNRAIITDD